MSELWDRLLIGWGELADVLPSLLAAALIMLAGYFVARQLQRWTDRTLERLHFKRLADAGGFTEPPPLRESSAAVRPWPPPPLPPANSEAYACADEEPPPPFMPLPISLWANLHSKAPAQDIQPPLCGSATEVAPLLR